VEDCNFEKEDEVDVDLGTRDKEMQIMLSSQDTILVLGCAAG
jgi:hypothetical protein